MMNIRIATIEDAKEIFRIEEECFSVPWSLDSIEAELSSGDFRGDSRLCRCMARL